jgi:hypothetical protein
MNAKQPPKTPLLFPTLLLTLLATLTLLTACMTGHPGPTAAERVHNGSPAPELMATAQADQYWRDAQATTAAQQATQQANYRNVQGTAQAAQATQVAQTTRDALHLSLTVDAATVQAQQTAVYATRTFETTATAQAQANAVATATEAAVIAQTTRTGPGRSRRRRRHRHPRRLRRPAAAAAGAARLLRRCLHHLRHLWRFLFGVVLLYLAWQLVPIATRAGLVRYGQHGNPLFTSQRHGRTIITDPLRMLQAALTVDEYGNVAMPHLTDDAIQTILAGDALTTLIEQARHAPGHAPILPSEVSRCAASVPGPNKTPSATTRPGGDHPAGPGPKTRRRTDDSANERRPLPLPGQSPGRCWPATTGAVWPSVPARGQQLITLDLARLPHLFVAGMSGAGKTRRLLRPLVAQALADGYTAVLMNESGSDFAPFYNQPQAAIVRGDVYTYMAVLEAAMDEMQAREQLLRDPHLRMAAAAGPGLPAAPVCLLAIDELLALAASLTPKEQKQFWALLTAFASRARKVGMCSLGLATDPTYRALGQGGLNYRSQCGRISFRMFQAAGSRAILDQNGAEQLEESQFLALLDKPGVQTGVAANPDDDELARYLHRQAGPSADRRQSLQPPGCQPR